MADIDDNGVATGSVRVVGPSKENTEWGATIRYRLETANLRFTSILFETAGDDITRGLWKVFPLGDIRRYIRETFKENPEWMSAGAMRGEDEQRRRAEQAYEVLAKNKPKRGPGRKNDEHWRAITDAYLYAVRSGGSQGLYRRVAEEIKRQEEIEYDEKTVKWMVERARDYGWLTRPGKGKVGGDLGPRYLEWKEQQE